MDQKVENFREYLCSIRKALGCYVCKKICFDPWTISRCGHSFCKRCIDYVYNMSRNCPRCVLQPITRRGIQKNYELEKVITQFHQIEDAFKADTHFDLSQDVFQPSHIVYQSKNVENMRSEANLLGRSSPEQNDISESLRQKNYKTPKIRTGDSAVIEHFTPNKSTRRKSSVSETEYFRRFKSLTFRKERIQSDKPLIVDNKRTSKDSIEGLQEEKEEEDEREIESCEDEEVEEYHDQGEESQDQKSDLGEYSPSLSNHGSDKERLLSEEKKNRKEASNSGEEEQASEEEEDVSDEYQEEEEDRIDTDKSVTIDNESSSVDSVESLQVEEEDGLEVESCENEEDLNSREESLCVSYHDSDEEGLLVEEKEIKKEISDSGEEEQENQRKQSLTHEHEFDQIESNEDREEEEDDEHNIDLLEESLRSLSHTSEEAKLLSNTKLHTDDSDIILLENFEVPESERFKSKSNIEAKPLEESVILLQPAFDKECSTIFLESRVATEASSTLIHALDLNSSSALESSQCIYDTYSFPLLNKGPALIMKVFEQKKPETKSPLRKKESLDDVSNFSGRRNYVKFFKKGRLNKTRKRVPFYYCGKFSHCDKHLADKDIVTVLSTNEMRNKLLKKSPLNRSLFDFGFKKLRENLNTETSKVAEIAQLGKRKGSVSKAKSVLENFKGEFLKKKPTTKNLEVPINVNQNNGNSDEYYSDSGTTELLSEYYQRMENNLNEQQPKLGTSKKRKSLISESEMTTERLNIKHMRVEFETGGDKLKMIECHPVSQRFVSRVEDSEAKEVERMRASDEDDSISFCQSFHIEKLDFGKDNLDAKTSSKDFEETSDSIAEERLMFERIEEERADRQDEGLILLSDGSKTPKRSFSRSQNISRISSEMKSKPYGRIIDNSNVIILSSEDEQSPPKKQEFKQQKLSSLPLDESNTKSKSSRRVRTDHSFGWKVKKNIGKK